MWVPNQDALERLASCTINLSSKSSDIAQKEELYEEENHGSEEVGPSENNEAEVKRKCTASSYLQAFFCAAMFKWCLLSSGTWKYKRLFQLTATNW